MTGWMLTNQVNNDSYTAVHFVLHHLYDAPIIHLNQTALPVCKQTLN